LTKSSPQPVFAAAGLAGLIAAIGQALLLRELLTLFAGHELSAGLLLTAWPVWVGIGSLFAGKYFRRRPVGPAGLALLLCLLGILTPLTLLAVRMARPLCNIIPGGLPDLAQTLGIVAATPAPFCLTAGVLFSASWSLASSTRSPGQAAPRPVGVYAAEAIGATVGGLTLTFLALPLLPSLGTALITAAIALPGAAWLIATLPQGRRLLAGSALVLTLAVLAAAVTGFSPLERLSRTWQWGPGVLALKDTPYQNLALLHAHGQYSLFSGGAWAFSLPDPLSDEHAVHPALLQHPAPQRVLLIGGNLYGLLREVFKHPSVRDVDYADPDPGVLRLLQANLPAALLAGAEPDSDRSDAPRVHIVHADAALYVRTAAERWDVVLMAAGLPDSLQRNRFYSFEFYEQLGRVLAPGGVFSFALPGSATALGPAQARRLRTTYATLAQTFAQVLALPGDQVRFLAASPRTAARSDAHGASASTQLSGAPEDLVERSLARGLELAYVRDYYLYDQLSPERRRGLERILIRQPLPPANRDFAPSCFFDSLLLASLQYSPQLKTALLYLEGPGKPGIRLGVGLLVLALLVIPRLSRRRQFRRATLGLVATSGGALMLLQITLLLAYQILAGELYSRVALFVAACMAGLALGSGLERGNLPVRPRLLLCQALLCLLLILTMPLYFALQALSQQAPGFAAYGVPAAFTLTSLISGCLGGHIYALAARALSDGAPPGAEVGGLLYAVDLTGAALAAAGGTLVMIPVCGLTETLLSAFALSLAALAALAISPGPTDGTPARAS